MLSACIDHLKLQPLWIIFVSSLGFLWLLNNASSLLKWIFILLLRPAKDLRSYGSWALITGSTDGIGKAFAFKLAQQGMNLVLVSRSSAKLEAVSAEIRTRCPDINIKLFELDFNGNDVVTRVGRMEEAIDGLDIGVLINNVGVTYPRPMYFHEVGEEMWMNVVRVNVEGTTHVTKAVVAGMIGRGRGAIVNIGSGASAVVPSHPLYAVYAATKAYVDQLSRSMYAEYKAHGINVQCQVPLYVSTRMATKVAFVEKSTVWIPSADSYVEAAVRWIGYESRCSPYWSHSVQWFLVSLLPLSLLHYWRLYVALKRMEICSTT